MKRLGAALGAPPANSTRPDELVQGGASDGQDVLPEDGPAAASATQQEAPPASNSSSAATPSSTEERTASVQALLAERAKRLEADQKAREAAAKAEREKRAQERREAAKNNSEPTSPNMTAAESSYAQMLRRKKQDEKDERQRILRRIEDDKKERREREAQEKQARLLLSAMDSDASTAAAGSSSPAEPPIQLRSRGGGPTCNLQVRLFDGSTVRGRFSRDDTLGNHVRKWVDDNRTDGDGPYTFRILLTPLPNKVVEPGEESETLGDLGLAPSATLVLVPVIRVASAYAGGGLLSRGMAYVYSWLLFFFSPLSLLFRGRGADDAQGGVPLENLDAHAERRRIRAFQNADDQRRDQQLYNGNSVSYGVPPLPRSSIHDWLLAGPVWCDYVLPYPSLTEHLGVHILSLTFSTAEFRAPERRG